MALELKRRSKQFLKNKVVDVELPLEDGAERVFGVYDVPSYFGEGKNFFRIKPRGIIKNNANILKIKPTIGIRIININHQNLLLIRN